MFVGDLDIKVQICAGDGEVTESGVNEEICGISETEWFFAAAVAMKCDYSS